MIEIKYDEIYNRVKSGKPFNNKLKPYSKIQLDSVLYFLEGEEEYEKCQEIKNFIDNRFTHELGFKSY
jgi:hypothetical protein